MADYQIGDVVRLRSGGSNMVVVDIIGGRLTVWWLPSGASSIAYTTAPAHVFRPISRPRWPDVKAPDLVEEDDGGSL